MSYSKESEMYPAVCQWLTDFLRSRHREAEVKVFDASRKSLARLIQETGYFKNLHPQWQSWDILVDIVGFVRSEKSTLIALAECKIVPLTLSHLSQTIGYSRIVLPDYSIVLSPQGASDAIRSLLLTYGRKDVLQYHWERGKLPRTIAVGRWSEQAGSVEIGSIISGNNNLWR